MDSGEKDQVLLEKVQKFAGMLERSSFEAKAVSVSALILAVLFSFATAVNFVLGLSEFLSVTTLLYSFCFWVIFYVSRFQHRYRLATPFLVGLTSIGFVVSWFTSNGIRGSTPMVLLAFIVYLVMITHGKPRFFYLSFLAVLIVSSILGEYLHPEWVTPYASTEEEFFDLVAGLVIGFTGVSFGATLIMNVYYRQQRELESERIRSDHLLQNIMPYEIAKLLKINPRQVIAQKHPKVAVGFIDIVGFTQYAAESDPHAVVDFLNDVFSEVDRKVIDYDLEKIKTIGDAYMVVGGMTHPVENPVQRMVELFESLVQEWSLRESLTSEFPKFSCRMGIHFGPLVAGVIGKHKYAFDVWGDTVNLASRLEMHGEENQIHISQSAFSELQDPAGFIGPLQTEIKGLGILRTYSKPVVI